MITISKNEARVFFAISQLLKDGKKSITRYDVAKVVPSVDIATVYRIIDRNSLKSVSENV